MASEDAQFDLVIQLFEGRNLRRVPTKRQAVVVQCTFLGAVRVRLVCCACGTAGGPMACARMAGRLWCGGVRNGMTVLTCVCVCGLCLIAQAQESTPAAWGRGDRARDPIWGGDAVLRWQLDSGTLHKLTQTKPYLHLNVYARSPRGTSYGADTTLGRVVIDLRRTSQTLAGDASADSAATPQWYNLADAAPGEILLSSRLVALQGGGGPSDGAGGSARIVDVPQSLRQSMERVPAVLAPTDADAIVIGAGGPESSLFTLSVSLFSLPSLLPLVRDHAGPFWLSYKLFGILVQVRPR